MRYSLPKAKAPEVLAMDAPVPVPVPIVAVLVPAQVSAAPTLAAKGGSTLSRRKVTPKMLLLHLQACVPPKVLLLLHLGLCPCQRQCPHLR